MRPGGKERTRWLLVQKHGVGDTESWTIPIEPMPFTIGRSEDCNLTLHSKSVSRHHAQIRSSGGVLWILDLGSTNGTFLNNKQISESEMLEAGDVVTFGRAEFVIRKVNLDLEALSTATLSISTEGLAQLVSLEPKLRKLIREQNVFPHFQPIVRFSDAKTVGYEILARIREPDLPSSPVELFDLAASLGCANELSSLFRERGVELGAKLREPSLLFVNTDPVEMDHLDNVLDSMERSQSLAGANRIVLEINEKVRHSEGMKTFHKRLTELNVALAFDDFGVGQTRLLELAEMPPDFLKFDMSLIRHIHLAPKRLQQMVLTFVKAARDLGIATLAEGIEGTEEAEVCIDIGFEYAQGYFYGRPAPISTFGVDTE